MITTSKLADRAKALEPFAKLNAPTIVRGAVVSEHASFSAHVFAGDVWRARAAIAEIEAELSATTEAHSRLLAALSDNPPDFASVHVMAGDLRKVLGFE